MYEYASGDTARRPSSGHDHDGAVALDRTPVRRPDEEAVLLDVAAHFAAEHGVPGPGALIDRSASLRAAARRWPLLQDEPRDEAAVAEVVELLRDAVDARDRFFPSHGVFSEEAERFLAEHPDFAAAHDRLGAFQAEEEVATDYVVVAEGG